MKLHVVPALMTSRGNDVGQMLINAIRSTIRSAGLQGLLKNSESCLAPYLVILSEAKDLLFSQ